MRLKLEQPIQILKQWDKRSAINSVATTPAVNWGTLIIRVIPPVKTSGAGAYQTTRTQAMLQTISSTQLLDSLNSAITYLQKYGTWQVQWCDINRYQRPADGITFNDNAESIPVGQTSSLFGQLPSFVSRTFNTKNAMDIRAIVL